MQNEACCFTGHRILPDGHADILRERILVFAARLIDEKDIRVFISGGARGFDIMAAETIIYLKKRISDIKLLMVLPCHHQEEKWNNQDKNRYRALLSCCDEAIYISETYQLGCTHIRNRIMVEKSSYCIAYLRSVHGGTAYTVKYAEKMGIHVIFI